MDSTPTRTLLVAGKTAEVITLMDNQAAAAARAYDEIRSDSRQTEDYKRYVLAVTYVQRRRDIDRRLAEMASKVVHIDRDDAERVFGIKALPGDVASLAISRRDAGDRVARVTDRAELQELLQRATRTGDEVLARAIAEKAVENRDAGTMEKFLADRPDLATAGERLWDSERAKERAQDESWNVTMALTALRPEELQGMSSDSIESLAQNEFVGSER